MHGFIQKVRSGKDLTTDEAHSAVTKILMDADEGSIYQFLVAMNGKETTVDELVGFVLGMKEMCVPIPHDIAMLVGNSGTGGDNTGTINISTGAAIIASAAGIPIAKGGNYAISSKCGSADVLEALGYNIKMAPEHYIEMVKETGFSFLFGPRLLPSFGRVTPTRKRVGKSFFNLVGPLYNPADVQVKLVGVYNPNVCEKFCYVLRKTGLKRGLVVHGSGLDEVSNTGETIVYELRDGQVTSYSITPEEFGFRRYDLADIAGGLPQENARELRVILANDEKGPKSDIIVLNAGATIYIGGGAESLKDGVKRAKRILESGSPVEKLAQIVEYSQRFSV